MASTKITLLPELTSPSSNGSNTVFVVVDKASGTFTTKQLSLTNLDLYVDNIAPYAYAQANNAYNKANSANITADSVYAFANIANIKVDSVYAFANIANIKVDSAYAWANTINIKTDAAYTKANAANVLAQAAYDKANLDTTSISTSPGFYGDSISVASFNLAANGRIISASNVAITANANTLSGTILKGTVVGSNLTSVGTLTSLNVTGNLVLSTSGYIGIGVATPDTELTILGQPQTVSYPVTGNSTTVGTEIHITGADASQTRITQDAFGTGSYVAFTGRSGRGTATSPTQTQGLDALAQFTGRGFSSGTLQFGNTSTGRVDVVAAENFTDTSRATNVQIYTTATGSILPTLTATFSTDGITANAATANVYSNALGYVGLPQNNLSSNYVITLADQGKHLYYNVSSNSILYIPTTANVAFPVGATIDIISMTSSGANVTITPNTGVSLYAAGNTTPAGRNLTSFGTATLVCVSANTWFVRGSGVSAL